MAAVHAATAFPVRQEHALLPPASCRQAVACRPAVPPGLGGGMPPGLAPHCGCRGAGRGCPPPSPRRGTPGGPPPPPGAARRPSHAAWRTRPDHATGRRRAWHHPTTRRHAARDMPRGAPPPIGMPPGAPGREAPPPMCRGPNWPGKPPPAAEGEPSRGGPLRIGGLAIPPIPGPRMPRKGKAARQERRRGRGRARGRARGSQYEGRRPRSTQGETMSKRGDVMRGGVR